LAAWYLSPLREGEMIAFLFQLHRFIFPEKILLFF